MVPVHGITSFILYGWALAYLPGAEGQGVFREKSGRFIPWAGAKKKRNSGKEFRFFGVRVGYCD
jgi:hypothetical protein